MKEYHCSDNYKQNGYAWKLASCDGALHSIHVSSRGKIYCSAWSKPKLNTKIGLHTTTTHHHKELFDQFQPTERIGVWYITILYKLFKVIIKRNLGKLSTRLMKKLTKQNIHPYYFSPRLILQLQFVHFKALLLLGSPPQRTM